jgi:hypothetical protein
MSDSTQMVATNPINLIQLAIEKGHDPTQIIALYERMESARAAEEFGRALSNFQLECPPIPKSRPVKNRDGTDRYKFAGFEDIVPIVSPILTRNKISYSFSVPNTKDFFEMSMRIQVGNHYRDIPYMAPMPDLDALAKTMYCSQPQAFMALNSYHKRNLFCNGFGIVTVGEDNDAVGCPGEPISADEIEGIKKSLAAKNVSLEKFLAFARMESLDQLTKSELKNVTWVIGNLSKKEQK